MDEDYVKVMTKISIIVEQITKINNQTKEEQAEPENNQTKEKPVKKQKEESDEIPLQCSTRFTKDGIKPVTFKTRLYCEEASMISEIFGKQYEQRNPEHFVEFLNFLEAQNLFISLKRGENKLEKKIERQLNKMEKRITIYKKILIQYQNVINSQVRTEENIIASLNLFKKFLLESRNIIDCINNFCGKKNSQRMKNIQIQLFETTAKALDLSAQVTL